MKTSCIFSANTVPIDLEKCEFDSRANVHPLWASPSRIGATEFRNQPMRTIPEKFFTVGNVLLSDILAVWQIFFHRMPLSQMLA